MANTRVKDALSKRPGSFLPKIVEQLSIENEFQNQDSESETDTEIVVQNLVVNNECLVRNDEKLDFTKSTNTECEDSCCYRKVPKIGIPQSNVLNNGFRYGLPKSPIHKEERISYHENESLNSDLAELKAKATQLRLTTRRASYVAWRQQLAMGRIPVAITTNIQNDSNYTNEATSRINTSLEWIKNELETMRTEDQILARTFLKLRSDMHELKLKWSCEDHKYMLEDTQKDLEETRQLQMICDRPILQPRSEHLRRFGVTEMNITARRFSTC